MARFLKALGIVVAIWLPGLAQTPAQAPLTKQQKIERILDATNPETAADEVVNQVRGMLQQLQAHPTAQQEKKRNEALDKISKLAYEHMRKVRPQLVKAYEETFSDEEIEAMFAYYTSPAGRAVTQKTPKLNERMSAVIQTEMDSAGKEINKIAEDSLK